MENKKIHFKDLSPAQYVKIETKEQFNKVAPYLRGKLVLYTEGTTLPTYVSPVINRKKEKSFGIQDDLTNLTQVLFDRLKFSTYTI